MLTQNIRGGEVIVEHGCWTLLKGGIVENFTSLVEIHFEVRKSRVKLQVTEANKAPPAGAKVFIKQTKSYFPFGCGMNHNILTSAEYQKWFASRFRYTTFTNEMKWYSTEIIKGQENYTIADDMLKFVKEKGISVRGHNVFWDNPKEQPRWVNSTLSPEELTTASAKRINSVVTRYKGQLIHWDVMNENLHFRFFEDKLGENASAAFYHTAQQLDPGTIMFLNEYNTIEYSGDKESSPANYKKKLEEILAYPGNANLTAGIGLQGHFGSGQPNLAYMRSVLDYLGAIGYPIWLTEVSVGVGPNQAHYLEEVLMGAYSHPAVQGIIMFVGPITAGFNETTLADKNFNNTASGDVVDKLIAEWQTGSLEMTTDDQGFIDVSLLHGDYEVTAEHSTVSASASLSFKVIKDQPQSTVRVQINT